MADFRRSPSPHVIYAEDQEVFREVMVAAMIKAGIPQHKIHVAGDGFQALQLLDKFQDEEENDQQLLMILDDRMPKMDGAECARKVWERREMGLLSCVPFVIGCSIEAERGMARDNYFQLKMGKHLGEAGIRACLEQAEQWRNRVNRARRVQEAKKSRVSFVLANAEPVNRMALELSLLNWGVKKETILEADNASDLQEVLASQEDARVILFLANPNWLQIPATGKPNPFVVANSFEHTWTKGSFHAALPPLFNQTNLKAVFQQYCGLGCSK